MKKTLMVLGCLLCIAVIVACVFSQDHWASGDEQYVPYHGAPDIYSASREELIGLDLVNYSGAFGEVSNEKEAVEIAAKVVKEVYGSDESPYVVKYNEIADAWIVHGSLPLFHLGGVASVAVAKETGEILMLIHTK